MVFYALIVLIDTSHTILITMHAMIMIMIMLMIIIL